MTRDGASEPEAPPQDEVVVVESGGAAAIDDVKARLAARGLIATRPAVVVPKEPRPEIVVAPLQPEASERHWAEAPEDSWDVDPGDSREVPVRCPQCREVHVVPLQSTRFVCRTGEAAWRWTVCEQCHELLMTTERQESWRCTKCQYANRSWWRTPAAAREASVVVARRGHQAVLEERAKVRAGMRKRRWKLIALGVVAALTAVGIVVGVRMAEPGRARSTAVACASFERLRADLANGTVDAAQLEGALEALESESVGAEPNVVKAVFNLGAAGPPNTSAFLVARTAVADACAAAMGR